MAGSVTGGVAAGGRTAAAGYNEEVRRRRSEQRWQLCVRASRPRHPLSRPQGPTAARRTVVPQRDADDLGPHPTGTEQSVAQAVRSGPAFLFDLDGTLVDSVY